MSECTVHDPLWTPRLWTILYVDQPESAVSLTGDGAQSASDTSVTSLQLLFERRAVLLGLVVDQALLVLNDALQRIDFSFEVSEFFNV